MGLEAKTLLHTEGLCFEINAILESTELIIRGPYKLRAPLQKIQNLSINGVCLCFEFEGDAYRLELGPNAKKWHDKILAPPKTLSEKLGLKAGLKIHALSQVSSDELKLAISASLDAYENANLTIAEIKSEDDLNLALKNNRRNLPIWLANIKGKSSILSENQIRETMRNNGFKDNKTCSINDIWSATRYHKV